MYGLQAFSILRSLWFVGFLGGKTQHTHYCITCVLHSKAFFCGYCSSKMIGGSRKTESEACRSSSQKA